MTSSGGFSALREHRLFRVATVYAVAGWLLIQFSDISLEAFDAPPWLMQSFLVVVLAGFPITLIAIWLLDGTNRKGTSTSTSLLTVAIALLASVGAYMFYADGGSPSSDSTAQAVSGRKSNPVLAVLPFTNMSSSKEHEYLADGMTEDVITLLARSPGAEVIARNSTFKYKNLSPDIRQVGADLGADFVVEGSIRPVGERLRVTVQVIDAESGAHIWAEKYDRPLTDIFEVQDEVSLGVAAAVGDAVFREVFVRASRSRTENLSAWELTSRAEVSFSHGLLRSTSVDLARQAIAADPEYGLAHAVLARSLGLFSLIQNDADLAAEARSEAELATRLAPNDPKVLAFYAITLLWTGNPVEALATAERVVQSSPGYVEGLVYYADTLIHNGRSEEAIEYFDRAIRLTPFAPQRGFYQFLRGEGFLHHGNFEAAEAALLESDRVYQGGNQGTLRYLAGAQVMLGKTEEARASLRRAEPMVPRRPISEEQPMMNRFTTDGGGPYFQAIWRQLAALTLEMEQEDTQ
jgi:TolB-like protein/Flp pilus assembly protein TadD